MRISSWYRSHAGSASALAVLCVMAIVGLPAAQAADQATHSYPSATAPTSDGDRASGGVVNGLGDPKGSGGSATSAQAPVSVSPKQPLGLADSRRMRQAAQVYLFEVQLAGLATAISDNETVRGYAVRMLEDNLKALDSLRSLANQHSVILPGGVENTSAAVLRNLALKTGAPFDTDYLAQAGLALQQQEMDFLGDTRKSAGSEDLRNDADRQIAVWRRHVQLAQKLAAPSQVAGLADKK